MAKPTNAKIMKRLANVPETPTVPDNVLAALNGLGTITGSEVGDIFYKLDAERIAVAQARQALQSIPPIRNSSSVLL